MNTSLNTNDKLTKIAVLGGGSWATALVKILSENNVKINWWMRDKSDIEHITRVHRNPTYLTGVHINPEKVTPTADIYEAMRDVEYVLLVIPSAFIKDAISSLTPKHFQGKKVVSTIKGMIPDQNILVTEFMEKYYNVHKDDIFVIAGPCHAEEVALERQSFLTVASNHKGNAEDFAVLLRCRYVKVSVIDDLYGVEYCAVMKNVIAIACGIARGLNYGDNFQAVLVSNAMIEIKGFIDKIYPQERNLNLSAYLGDLLVTSYSQFSRNRTLGNMVGRGYSVKAAQVEMGMVAEGYYGVKCIFQMNKIYGVNMPINKAVYHILYEKISPAVEIQILKESMN